MSRGKYIHRNDMLGQSGVGLIAKIIGDMGYIWRPTGLFDAGIDGQIEIRDPQTGEAKNALIGVQSKATGNAFISETDIGFTYTVEEKDLNYWLRGNLPVILVVSRPKDDVAYWMSIKDYFSTPERRAERRVRFNKAQNCLDVASAQALATLALPTEKGAYLSPRPKAESLYCNLLPVSDYAARFFVAPTTYRSPKDIWNAINTRGTLEGREWFLSSGMIYSLHDLREDIWHDVCDPGDVDDLPSEIWATSKDPAQSREFVQMLNLCLNSKLELENVRYSRDFRFHYFLKDESNERHIILPGKTGTGRTVVKGYQLDTDYPHFRHFALKSKFLQFEQKWFLELEPTYHFTSDGINTFRFYESRLSGIKRFERNDAVRYLTSFWASLLSGSNDLYSPRYPWLNFDSPEIFKVNFGIHEAEWKQVDEETQADFKLDDDVEDIAENGFFEDLDIPLFEGLT